MHYATLRDHLINTGYKPIPIIPRDKRPAVEGWAAPDFQAPKGYGGHGIGIVCGTGPYPVAGIDLDITDEPLAAAMLDYVVELCGETLQRVGRAPKTLLMYRHAAEGTRKITSRQYEIGRVEILGAGQQFVAYGTHPITKQPYKWPGILGEITDVPASELPVVTPEQLRAIVARFEELAQGAGYTPVKKDPPANTATLDDFDPEDPLDRKAPLGIPLEKLAAMLDTLDPDCGRDMWRNLGMALHHETAGSDEGLQIWDTWSRKGTKYKDDEPAKQWESFGRYRGRPITAAYLLKHAKQEDIWSTPDFFKSLNWSTSRFLDDPPPIPVVVQGMLPRGIVSLFYSAGGAGKSTIVMYMCAKIAWATECDADFLGHGVTGGKVVIVTAEDPDLILNRRFIGIIEGIAADLDIPLANVRAAVDKNLSIVSTFGHAVQLFALKNDGTLKTTAYYENLIECLAEIKNLQLVVIDTKTRYSPAEGLGNVTATQEITHYEAMAQRTGASVMLLHHSNKASRDGSQTGMQAYRDASAIYDSVRAAWYLRSMSAEELLAQSITAEGSYLYLENSKNNYLPLHAPLILCRDGYRYTAQAVKPKTTAEQKKEAKRQQVYDRVIAILQTAKGKSFSQADAIRLCRDEDIGRKAALSAIGDACEDGLIERTTADKGGTYKYTLTEAGKIYNNTIEGVL